MLTNEHYNSAIGTKYRKALQNSRVTTEGGTHGLAGGFHAGTSGLAPTFQSLNDVPTHDSDDFELEEELQYQSLGGKIKPAAPGDPIYMLGSFHEDGLHLSRLDALAQMRPQLHHVDAQDEIDRKRTSLANVTGNQKPKANLETGPAKIETKAIDIKVKSANDDGRDRGINANAKLLRDIQAEQWQAHEWIDESEDASTTKFEQRLHHADTQFATQLKSKLSNSEWLDKMSAPREAGHGKKGLLAKLRGRERERARRKKNEEEKARKAQEQAAKGGVVVQGSLEQEADTDDSELSDLTESDEEDVVMIDMTNDVEIEVKEEPEPVSAPVPAPKKRGRPPKQPPRNTVTIADD
jgi:hypothetical protein